MDTFAGGDIPRLAHFIWLGSEPSDELVANIETFRRLNPTWDVRLWRDNDLGWLANRSDFEGSPTYAGRANIARYEIVLRHGGFYCDADFEFLRPLDDLEIDFNGLVVARENQNYLCNALFGAPANHPFLARLVDKVSASISFAPTAPTQTTSGPLFFTRELDLWSQEASANWTEIDRDLVFPYSFDRNPKTGTPLSPEVVAIHHWHQAHHGRAWVQPVAKSEERGPSFIGKVLTYVRPRSRLKHFEARVKQRLWRPNSLDLGNGRALSVGRFGRPLIFDTSDVNLLGNLMSTGEWDERFHMFLQKNLSGSDVYVDVGANIGQFVATASKALNSYGRIFAYEPNPRAFETLKLNVQMNRTSGAPAEVLLRPVAVAGASGSVTLHIPSFHAGRATVVANSLEDIDDSECESISVPCVTLDEELKGVSRIRLLKIDVEGNEPAVLAGARELVESGRVDLIDIESVRRHLGSSVNDLGQILDRWQDMGATFSEITANGDLREISGRASSIISTSDRSHLVISFR